jgi:formamidopyrimidine-DNA glycosylase
LHTDEILYHARIHPEAKSHMLDDKEMERLHHWTEEVPRFAVGVNADDSKFPEDWLFKHRWGKGKSSKKGKKGEKETEDGLKLVSSRDEPCLNCRSCCACATAIGRARNY